MAPISMRSYLVIFLSLWLASSFSVAWAQATPFPSNNQFPPLVNHTTSFRFGSLPSSGYLTHDAGGSFRGRGGGWSYGFVSGSYTLNSYHSTANIFQWSVQLPAGTYRVCAEAGLGNPALQYWESGLSINLSGLGGCETVTITDGSLRLINADSEFDITLEFLSITPLSFSQAQVAQPTWLSINTLTPVLLFLPLVVLGFESQRMIFLTYAILAVVSFGPSGLVYSTIFWAVSSGLRTFSVFDRG